MRGRLSRSVLFVPCDRLKLMEKALSLNTDVIVFDLEDAGMSGMSDSSL